MRRVIVGACSCWLIAACGSVKGAPGDAPDPDDGPVDGAADGPQDSGPECPPFEAPPGSTPLHDRFCNSALGFNPTATPTTMNLACPGVGTGPGTYGLILRLPETQADGCPATTPVTRIIAPAVNEGSSNALTQTSTGQDLVVAAGSRLRMRLACREGIANCRGRVQITGAPAAAGSNVQIFPATGFQIVEGDVPIDVDVEMPASLVGTTTDLNLVLVFDGGVGTPDVLFENPHLAPP